MALVRQCWTLETSDNLEVFSSTLSSDQLLLTAVISHCYALTRHQSELPDSKNGNRHA